MSSYKTIAENTNSTVVAEYISKKKKAGHYQSEDDLEKEFIRLLETNGYEYLTITESDDLLDNLRNQLSELNKIKFSEDEWHQILNDYLTKKNESIKWKTIRIQEDYIYNLECDDGSTKNIRIIDKDNVHNNIIQVINQYETEGKRKNRYDVTILINGLPMVHIELKRRGVSIKEAFNQINRYQEESFWADSGLFEYIQLFVISNGTHTKYYSNTARNTHLKEKNNNNKSRKKTSNSFEFTSWWADAKNREIPDLVDFTKTFFSKHTLLSIITKYCIFTTDKMLLVMRPYQIVATERIINKIIMSTNHKNLGSVEAGGFIWHATGSGKTLTSFKTAQIASKLEGMGKVLFVVDRKDLDYQTIKEYDKFEKDSANSNTSTAILTKQLSDPNVKIIITTIQKLKIFIDKNKGHDIFNEHVVLIFDECHRSHFGRMHKNITKTFKKYNMFGFTGTPILPETAQKSSKSHLKITKQAFGDSLHIYTIVDAINDENVLPFRIDYTNTMKMKNGVKDKKIIDIDTEAAINAPKRISLVTDYILEHFDQKTKRNKGKYTFDRLMNIAEVAADKEKDANKRAEEIRQKVRLKGFNSIFAVSSIKAAKKYYDAFQSRDSGLKIATIFSFAANEEENDDGDEDDGAIVDESFDTSGLDKSSRDFLDSAIADYNEHFGTSYDTSVDKFENYYRDISQRMKNREIDMLIVVNMFLTGFDATTLNTLWVDKNLRHHGLLQAFSRTNRILNSIKTFGHIVCFRNLEDKTNEALRIFGDKETAKTIVLLKSFDHYYEGYEKEDGEQQKGYKDLIAELQDKFPLPLSILGEQVEKEFIMLWGAILRARNILTSFDEFEDKQILSEQTMQDYQSEYIRLYEKLRKYKEGDKENINDDIEFEVELVKQVTVTIGYILGLVTEYHEYHKKTSMTDDTIITTIERAMDSSFELRDKKELILRFIKSLNASSEVDKDWRTFVDKNKEDELNAIIAEEKLKPELTKKYIKNAFRDGELKSTGTGFASILPPMSMFDIDNTRGRKKVIVLEKLKVFFEKYLGA